MSIFSKDKTPYVPLKEVPLDKLCAELAEVADYEGAGIATVAEGVRRLILELQQKGAV